MSALFHIRESEYLECEAGEGAWERMSTLTQHPCNHVPSQTKDEDQRLETVNSRKHNNRQCRYSRPIVHDEVYEIPDLYGQLDSDDTVNWLT
jgi:hypothetical protein